MMTPTRPFDRSLPSPPLPSSSPSFTSPQSDLSLLPRPFITTPSSSLLNHPVRKSVVITPSRRAGTGARAPAAGAGAATAAARGLVEPLQRHLGSVLPGVVDVLAVVPEPRAQRLAVDRDRARPGCSAAYGGLLVGGDGCEVARNRGRTVTEMNKVGRGNRGLSTARWWGG